VSPAIGMTEDDLKEFIHGKLSSRFGPNVISVSVQRYPSEYSVTVWLGQEATPDVRQYGYELEAELSNLGVPCSIVVKSDQERPLGGIARLHTRKGQFSYRYLKADPVRDEDVVYVFSVYKGSKTYRYRLSLSGTLASMLRRRNRFDEARILAVYLDQIRGKIDGDGLREDGIEEITLDSRHQHLFWLK